MAHTQLRFEQTKQDAHARCVAEYLEQVGQIAQTFLLRQLLPNPIDQLAVVMFYAFHT